MPLEATGPAYAFGAESGLGRNRPGSSRIAYPASAEMMDPAMVRKREAV
jgi:hypothetical protein